jgi:hypothetical protein
VIHGTLLFAAHAQPAVVVTVIEPVPPAEPNEALAGEMEKLHGAAACVTVKIFPATLSVPARELFAVLAATE